MLLLRRLALGAAIAALACSVAFVAGYAIDRPGAGGPAAEPAADAVGHVPDGSGRTSSIVATPEPVPDADAGPHGPTPTPTPTPTRSRSRCSSPDPSCSARATRATTYATCRPACKQISWFNTDVSGTYGDVTTAAVRGFQAKREIPVTGVVDQRTLDRLYAMTTTPTQAELHNRGNTAGALDPRCRTGRVLCIDKTSSTLRFVIDGTGPADPRRALRRPGPPPVRASSQVYVKDADHVSRLYGSSMPYAMFFSGGQAVHYSSDFASVGYAWGSHGCVNIRDHDGIAHLYDQVRVGDRVVVYWS